MIKVNGIDLEFNSLDADDMEKAEKAKDEVVKKLSAFKNEQNISESGMLRKTCSVISECFDKVFGPGAGDKILKGTQDAGVALDAFGQFKMQTEVTAEKKVTEIISRYTPNRDARRHPKKK